MYAKNPLAMGSAEKIAIGVGVVAGLGALLYYTMRPAAAATAPVPTPAPPPPATAPPAPNGTGGGGSVRTFNVTDADSGAILSLNRGDTLLVTLPLSGGITDYIGGQTGALLTKGVYTKGTTIVTQPWIATQSGSETVSYQGSAGSINLGPLITYTINVS